VAKPRYRWRAPTKNRHAKARPFGSTCRWKAFWVEQAAPFDEGAGEAILGTSSEAWSTDRAERGARQRTSEVVHQLRAWPTTPRRGGAALRAVAFDSSSPEMARSGRVVEWTEAGDRAVKRALPGAGSPKGGLAPQLPTSSGSGGGGGRRGESHALGNHAIHGCSCRESVAEVGEEHLSRAIRGEPRGKPRRREIARHGGSCPDRAEPPRGGRKGARLRRANLTVSVTKHHSIARSRTESAEGVLDQ